MIMGARSRPYVSPSIELSDEQAVLEVVLEGLEKASISADLAIRLWNETGAIRVCRREPLQGRTGKLLPLHSNRNSNVSRVGQRQ